MKIRTKIVVAFICLSIIPLIIAGGWGFFKIDGMNNTILKITSKSLKTQLELSVDQQVKQISSAASLYINQLNLGSDYKSLQYNPEFMNLIIQVIGSSGYTFLVNSQGEGHTIFMHPNPRFLSKDIDTLGIKKMKRLLDSVVQKKDDYKGNIKDQYIFIHPVDKKMPFYMVALVPVNDIKSPIKQLTSRMNQLKKDFRNSYFYFGILFTILVFLFALLFGIRIIRPITKLTNVAEKISLGDLKTLIDIDTDDEIGELASALRRMQASLFKAVSRLQKRE